MRNNINIKTEGNTNVKLESDRLFDSKTAGFGDSNQNWDDFQTYYDENQFKLKHNTKVSHEAAERGKYFVRGQMILMALDNELKRKAGRKLEVA